MAQASQQDGAPAGARPDRASAAARRSLVSEMARGYLRPRRAMLTQVRAGLTEPRALFHLMLGAVLLCAASVPEALRSAGDLPVEDAANVAIASRIFGFVFLLPLLAYGAAALITLVAGRGRGLAVRSALFWTVLLGGPLALVLSAVATVAGAAGAGVTGLLGAAALGYWLWLAAAALGAALDRATHWALAGLVGCFLLLSVGIKLSI